MTETSPALFGIVGIGDAIRNTLPNRFAQSPCHCLPYDGGMLPGGNVLATMPALAAALDASPHAGQA
jgi:hypothetical protein